MDVTLEGIGSGGGTDHEELLAALLSKLVAQNEELAAQSAKLSTQNEELAAQSAKLSTQDERLTEQSAKLSTQDERLTEQSAKLAAQNDQLTEQSTKLAEVEAERDAYRRAYEKLKEELLLVKRRLFIATAERVDTTQLELEFAELSKKLDALGGQVSAETEAAGETAGDAENAGGENAAAPCSETTKRKTTGRRNLAETELSEETVELADDLFEELVADGKAERIGFETSYRLRRLRGGMMRVAVKRVKYRAVDSRGKARIETTPLPPELLRRGMAAPSLLAHVAVQKFCDGLPLFRIEDRTFREGFRIDRGTMSRWMEEIGATFGATVVHAMNEDAVSRAFCIATDATGFAVQPGPREGPASPRRPCRKGHYFVRIADRDHIFFEFSARHTTQVVRGMFQGFEGYVQADAATVYDALFRSTDDEHDGKVRHEVACWSHARRKYWEAAFAKEPVAREALLRIQKVFAMDAECRGKRRPPSKIRSLRQAHLRPLIEDFLSFAEREYAKVESQRSSLRSALGYTVRQADALRAFLDDGRLRMDNNLSERELRKVVRIRDASLFAGSDEHAEAAGHILSLIASARLHNLDPEHYLRDLIRVLPHWPKGRFLELSPLHWTTTRQRLDPAQLVAELGHLDIPAPAQ